MVALLAAAATVQPALSQQSKAPAAQSQSQARKALSDGVKSYRAGKTSAAFSQLDKAITGGGLGPKELARALYYRGLVHRKLGSPAKAISDLNSAIYVSGGLSEKERATAVKNRDLAYRDAGVKPKTVTAAVAKPAAAPVATAKAPAPRAKTPAKKTEAGGGPIGGWKTTTEGGAAGASNAVPSATSTSTGNSNPLAGVGNFFSNLFGGSSNSASAPKAAAPTTTGSLSGANDAVSSWTSTTTMAPKATDKTARLPVKSRPAPARKTTVARKAPTAKITPRASQTGRFVLNAGAERSQDGAKALAQRIKQAHAAALGGREPRIQASKYGNMGTFYRLQIGSYSHSAEAKKLCSSLKSSGIDCWVSGQ